MQTGQLISLALYFILMLGIGFYAWRTTTDDVSGYMLGGRKLSPAVASLSAGASDMSGWMLLGLPGAMYVSGLSASWIAIGLFIGAFLNWVIVAPRLRVHTEIADDAITIPDYFEKRFEDKTRLLRIISSIVIVIFFTLYTSSGVVAGGKLFESAFGADYALGLWITAGVVVVYTLFGGFLAVSMTDFVQGCIMFVALVLVPVVALTDVGGMEGLGTTLNAIDPNLTDLFGGVTLVGIISAMAWGLGYFGQPHIIVRFMAIRSVQDVPRARNIGMTWMGVTIVGALATGLIGLAYATQNGLAVDDPETIFIILSQILFHPLIAGFLLAAILAAIMSTISSQLLVSSSSLTEDFYGIFLRKEASQKELVLIGRLSVVAVSLVAIALAYNPNSNVLGLVSNAWAGFGAAFGPIILLSLTWNRMTRNGALFGMIAGAATVLFWIYTPVLANGATLSSLIYEIVPGFIVCGLVAILVSLFGRQPADTITQTFERARAARTA
ncbi:sodium/proline symporter PutP [Parasphingopyxis lamellibrachiae]|uniref:Sodium/proline symporter n=1 Tax=Parasphingopyxis lamellibrachiae TaxID=680125 RepID=A0A3D9FER9_9SPHN|nr:sodium/proline symporter PutP [Parasphingopyxis lamellibrachiae]RED15566.1 SSS family solute:Na+ symporter/sodium/proline symporter [Parasphingopyxis lamellibrachiae]